MALELLIGLAGAEVDHIQYLVWETLTVDQRADSFVSTASFQLIDETGSTIQITEKDSVILQDGATKYFAGVIANIDSVNFAEGKEAILYTFSCQDYNILVEEVVVDQVEEYGAEQDSAIIDDLFDTYLPEINTHGPGDAPPGYVQSLHVFAEIEFVDCSLREALDRIATEVETTALAGYWYIDYDKYLHYFNEEDNSPGWGLSDTPDNVTTFDYHSAVTRHRESSSLVNRVLVVGADVALLVQDLDSYYYYGKWFEAVVRDNTLFGVDDVVAHGYSLLNKWSFPDEYFEVTIDKEGLRAGMNLEFTNALFGTGTRTNHCINPSFENNVVDGWTFAQAGAGGSAAQDNTHVLRGTQACKLTADDVDNSRMCTDNVLVADGETVTVHVNIYREDDIASLVRLYDVTNANIRAAENPSLTDVWEAITLSWTNDTGLGANIRLYVYNTEADGASFFWFDAAVVEIDKGPRPIAYIDGTMPYCDWTGAAHNSTSYRSSYYMVKQLTITWPDCDTSGVPEPRFSLQLGGQTASSSLIKGRLAADKYSSGTGPVEPGQIPISSKGWAHDLVFSATDHDTVEWAAGTITTADGTVYSIGGGNTGNMLAATVYYIYLDIDVSEVALQVTGLGPAVGRNILLVAVAYPNADATKEAEYQVFGGQGVNTFITADNIAANTITGNEIAANTITAGNIQAGTITATEIAANTITGNEIAANTITADKLTIGEPLFHVADGLLLLGPTTKIDKDNWYGTRNQVASILGAFHREQGRWQGTRGLVIERTTTNYVFNPSFEVDNSNWAVTLSTITRTTDDSVFGDACAEVDWAVGNGHYIYSNDSGGGTAAQGDEWTVSAYLKYVAGDTEIRFGLFELNAAGNWIATQFERIILTSQWTRYDFTFTLAEALADQVCLYVGEDNDTASTFLIDGAQIEKWSWASTYCDGSMGEGYSWAGTAHASASTREATYVNLDSQIGLIDGKNTLTHSLRVRMPFDHDIAPTEAGWTVVYLVTYRDDATNDRMLLYYDFTDDKFKANVNGAFALESSAQTFVKGDEIHLVVTLDYSGDEYNFYVDGELEDTDTTAETAPSGIDHWNLGSEEDDGALPNQMGCTYSEYAVFDAVLSAADVGNLYNLQRPLVDMGSPTLPGIYIYDGQFVIASSIDGARVEITSGGITGYNASEETFILNTDGSGQIGASSYEPITWDTTGLIQKLKAIQMSVGQPVISSDDALLILGPYGFSDVDTWYGSRGEIATISGAFHTEQGYWEGTRGLVVEIATTNYCLAPRMIEDDATGVADGWAYSDNLGSGGNATLDVVPHQISERGWMQRMTYSGAVGDVDDFCQLYDYTDDGTFAQDDYVTISLDIRGETEGVEVYIITSEFDNGDVLGTTHTSGAKTISWMLRRISYTVQMVDADCDHISVVLRVAGVDNGDELDVYFGAVNVEKRTQATSFCCGALDWCSWSGDADDSESTRTATEVNLDDHADVLSDQNEQTFIIWAKMPCDADATWPRGSGANYFLDYRGANDNNRVLVHFDEDDDKFTVWINGAERFQSSVQTFVAEDEKLLVLTLDFSNDDYYLYIDGELDGDDDTNLTAPTAVVSWNLGSSHLGTYQSGATFSGYAVLNTVLTADEVARIWLHQQPLIDAGSMDKPGIYILDGRFKIASSATGNRIEITADEITGYDSVGAKQFYLRSSDGKALAGGGDVWLDENGIGLAEGAGFPNSITWYDGATEKCHIRGGAPGDIVLELKTGPCAFAVERARVALESWDSASSVTSIHIDSHNGATDGIISFVIDDDSEMTINDGYVSVVTDLRVGGGIYIGSVAGNPDADKIHFDSASLWMRKDTADANSIEIHAADWLIFDISGGMDGLRPDADETGHVGSTTIGWYQVNAKVFHDIGCLGYYDEGVEVGPEFRPLTAEDAFEVLYLEANEFVSATEALMRIRPMEDGTKTIHNVQRLDYSTLPATAYAPAYDDDGNYVKDRAELTALIGILISAVRELTTRVKELEQ